MGVTSVSFIYRNLVCGVCHFGYQPKHDAISDKKEPRHTRDESYLKYDGALQFGLVTPVSTNDTSNIGEQKTQRHRLYATNLTNRGSEQIKECRLIQ